MNSISSHSNIPRPSFIKLLPTTWKSVEYYNELGRMLERGESSLKKAYWKLFICSMWGTIYPSANFPKGHILYACSIISN